MSDNIIYDVEEPKDDETGDGSVVDGSVVDGSVVDGSTGGGATGGGSTGSGSSESGIPYTVPGMSYVPLISGGKKDNSTWLSEQGVDFDKEYAEGKAALDYDYMTSMATYGQRAEELYQMGLSGSGVSDIYQLGAFSEHIQAQNDLRLAIIDKKKEYSKLYNDYSNEWDRNYKTDYGNAYNTGLSMYTGQNIDAVRQQLTGQGYDASIVEQVVSSLSALDPATLPTVKAFNTEVNEAYAAGYELYRAAKKADGTFENNADEVYNKLLAAGYSPDVAAAAKAMLLDIPESDWANLPTVKNFSNTVEKAYAAGYELYRAAKKADGTFENNADEVYNKLLAAGYSPDVAAAAKAMLLDIPESDWANLPTVKNFSNTVEKAYAAGYDLYNGKNADEVYNKLLAAGYSPDVALEAKNKLLAIPENEWANLPTVKNFSNTVATTYTNLWDQFDGGNLEQIISKYLSGGGDNNVAEEVRKQINEAYGKMSEEEKAALKEKQINNAFAMIDLSKYDSSEPVKNQVKTTLEKIYSKAVVDAVIERADNAYKAAKSESNINSAYQYWVEQKYSKDMETRVRNVYGENGLGWSDEDINTLIGKLNATAAVTQPDKDAIIKDGAQKLAAITDENGNVIYDGSESSKTVLRQLMDNAEYSDYAPYIDEILAEIDENKRSLYESGLKDLVNADLVYLSQSNFLNAIESAKIIYGEGTVEYQTAIDTITQKANESIKAALETEAGFKKAYTLVGKSATEWAAMDDADKMIEILYAVGRYAEDGIISKYKKQEYFESWFKTELSNLPVSDSSLSEIEHIQKQINDFKENGVINENLARHFNDKLRGARQAISEKVNEETKKSFFDVLFAPIAF